PFIVSGDGGHNVNPLVRAKKGQQPDEPQNGMNVDYLESRSALKVRELILEKYDDINYGYLTRPRRQRAIAHRFSPRLATDFGSSALRHAHSKPVRSHDGCELDLASCVACRTRELRAE